MFEVTTIEDLDDPREIDADSYRKAVEEYVDIAVSDGYWDDISQDDTVEVKVRREEGRWYRYRAILDEETMRVAVAKLS